MVIIKRDDYISFLNTSGAKMPTPPASVNSVATIKRDSSQQQLAQLQQYQQQQQQLQAAVVVNVGDNKTSSLARSVLVCRPNSHPFSTRTLLLEPNKVVKIGRAIARTKVSDANAIFDCKVLSRNHAELWYNEGKFFIKDTGSSNGTFINNQRLSQTCNQSEPYEVSSGDIVQFGVDVMENSRKETHGCIVATLKLYLPDGRETKASQSTLVGPTNTKVPQVDLYRLNQYIQEASQREQILESKLLNIQKKAEMVKMNSSSGWQALVDEDRLLSRIDMLEKKLMCFSKATTDDKLREEVQKLQSEKLLYQSKAKDALKKVYNERLEAMQKLTVAEKTLLSAEDECTLLRDQLNQTHTQSQETTQRLDVIQNMLDEKCVGYEEQIYKKDAEVQRLNTEINEMQEKLQLGSYKRSMEINDYENSQMVENWLLKSDIKNIEGSDDIIKAICGEDEEEDNLAKSLESNCSLIYLRLFSLEKELSSLLPDENNTNAENNNGNNNINGSENNMTLNETESSTTINQQEQDEKADQMNENNEESQQTCDDNQNNVHNHKMVISLDNKNLDNVNNNGEKVQQNIKQILALYSKLKKQIIEYTENNQNELGENQARYDELSAQLLALRYELDQRPTPSEYALKIQQCNDLNDNVTDLRHQITSLSEQVARNQKLMAELEIDLQSERARQEQKVEKVEKIVAEVEVQTDKPIVETPQPIVDKSIVAIEEVVQEHVNEPEIKDKKSIKSGKNSKSIEVESSVVATVLESPQAISKITTEPHQADQLEGSSDDLNKHPKVLLEDEIVFKEQCATLQEDNDRLTREIAKMSVNLERQQELHQFIVKYLMPLVAIFFAYVFFLAR